MSSTPSIARIDGADIWCQLTADQQARIGAIAVELAVVSWSRVIADDNRVVTRACDAAGMVCLNELDEAIADAPVFASIDPANPPVPARIGDICIRCGCTEHDACFVDDMPCRWVAPGLCSSCVAHRGDLSIKYAQSRRPSA